jgi:hypothetical protein
VGPFQLSRLFTMFHDSMKWLHVYYYYYYYVNFIILQQTWFPQKFKFFLLKINFIYIFWIVLMHWSQK